MHNLLNEDFLSGSIENFTEVASDIWTLPLFTERLCDTIVERLEKSKFNTQPGDGLPIEEIMLEEFDSEFTRKLNQYIENCVGEFYYQNYANAYFKVLINWINRLGEVVTNKNIHQDSIVLHNDKSRISMSLILNDDFKGGEIFFPRQEYKTTGVPKGTLICWPGQITHPHTILPVSKGTRYSLVTFTKLESFSTRERQLSDNF